MASECAQSCRQGFHYSSFCLCYNDWKPFSFSPWLPEKYHVQLIYVVFRWILALFFGIYLFIYGFAFGDVRFFIYLTSWGYLLLTLYFVWCACTVTYTYVKLTFMAKTRIDDPATEQISNSGCCGVETNALTWYQMIQWVLFTTSLSASIIVVFLYWVLLVPTFDFNCDVNTTDADDCLNVFAHTQIIPHLITGVAAVIDLGFSGIPIRLLHVVYPVVGFAVPYGIFSGLYYVAGGVDIFGNPYIYPILDYGSNPGMAIGLIVMATLVVLPAVHLVIFFMFHLRKRAVVITHKYVCPKREDENTGNAETALDSPC